MRRPPNIRIFGFSLIEMSVAMVVLGILVGAGLSVAPQLLKEGEQAGHPTAVPSDQLLDMAEGGLLAFLATHNRLPCPDSSNEDGLEDCGDNLSVGEYPWRSLGFSAPLADSSETPVRYGVYRYSHSSTLEDADLADATEKNRFIPSIPGYTASEFNLLDFCTALRNAIKRPEDSSMIHTVDEDGIIVNPAFILVSGHSFDAEGDAVNGSFDGRNEAGVDFEQPSKDRSRTYDDVVRSVGLFDLSSRLSCGLMMASANSLAMLATADEFRVEQAKYATSNGEWNVEMTGWDIADAALGTIGNAADICVAGAQLVCDIPASPCGSTSAIAMDVVGLGGAVLQQILGFVNLAERTAALIIAKEHQATAEELEEAAQASAEISKARAIKADENAHFGTETTP
ncbi:MAG: prepilin-type N-terminal cleavage/methylation domain-containing protein [Magnetococcales bacterium]|nr:prepilin-type N-terminal cleavage/methylation domain-containing protein [Magnetococcales bacterium]